MNNIETVIRETLGLDDNTLYEEINTFDEFIDCICPKCGRILDLGQTECIECLLNNNPTDEPLNNGRE